MTQVSQGHSLTDGITLKKSLFFTSFSFDGYSIQRKSIGASRKREKKMKVVVLRCRPRQNVELGTLSCSRATTAEKWTKKRDARAKL